MTADDDFDSQTRLPIIRGCYPYGSWPCISCTNNALFSVYTLRWRICLFRNMIAAILFDARGSTYLDIGSNFASCHWQINPAFSSFIRTRIIRAAIEWERSGRVNNFCCCASNARVSRILSRSVDMRWILILKTFFAEQRTAYYYSSSGISLRFSYLKQKNYRNCINIKRALKLMHVSSWIS